MQSFLKSVCAYACGDLRLTGKIFLISLDLLFQSLLHQTKSFQISLVFLFSLLWPYVFSASLVLITSFLPKPLDIYYLKWSLILLGKYFNHGNSCPARHPGKLPILFCLFVLFCYYRLFLILLFNLKKTIFFSIYIPIQNSYCHAFSHSLPTHTPMPHSSIPQRE